MITVHSGGEGLETLTHESHSNLAAPGPWTISLIPSQASKPVPFQRTLTQQPSSLELELPQQGWLAPGLEVGLCAGASSLLCHEPFSETVALLYYATGWALSKAMGLFCLMVV